MLYPLYLKNACKNSREAGISIAVLQQFLVLRGNMKALVLNLGAGVARARIARAPIQAAFVIRTLFAVEDDPIAVAE